MSHKCTFYTGDNVIEGAKEPNCGGAPLVGEIKFRLVVSAEPCVQRCVYNHMKAKMYKTR